MKITMYKNMTIDLDQCIIDEKVRKVSLGQINGREVLVDLDAFKHGFREIEFKQTIDTREWLIAQGLLAAETQPVTSEVTVSA